jgi:hypothetical protein
VDISFNEAVKFKKNSFYETIGELTIENEICLKSRILNCIDDFDVDIFVKTMKLKRNFVKF